MKTLENFKSEKIDLQQIHGSGYGGGMTTGATRYYSTDPDDSWISFNSSGEITGSHNMIIYTELDEGSYY